MVRKNWQNDSGLDWAEIKSIDDLLAVGAEKLYDYTEESDPNRILLNPDLTDEEIEDALWWWPVLSRGIVLITGPPGMGKTGTMTALVHKARYYYLRYPILDYKPRPAFGDYIPMSVDFLVNQIQRVNEMTQAGNDLLARQQGHRWFATQGEVFIKNAVMGLDEFGKKWMPHGSAGNPVNQLLASLGTIWRHLNLTIIGCATDIHDVDAHNGLPKVTVHAKSDWSINKTDTTILTMRPVQYNGTTGVLNMRGKKRKVRINGRKPIRELGLKADGTPTCLFDLCKSGNDVAIRIPNSLLAGRS